MSTINDLLQVTEEFFKLYWNPSNGPPPKWSEQWDFNSPIPNNDKRGCYSLFKGKEIKYIGVGIGKSFGNYHGSGLGDRLKRYWQVNKDHGTSVKYKPTKNWAELSSLITIGFSKEHYHLAAALEIYLINRLNPVRNSQHK